MRSFARARRPRSTEGPRDDGERGAVLVELALTLPVMVMLLLGTISSGFALYHKMSLVQASREAARYGAALPQDQCISYCGGQNWAQFVRSRAVSEANGDIQASEVCVALVSGSGAAPVAVDASHTTAGGTSPCFADNVNTSDLRVQVLVAHPDVVEWGVARSSITITTKTTAKYEQ